MKKIIMMIVAVIALAAVVASPAMAYREQMVGYGNEPGNAADIAATHGLELKAEQTRKIDVLRDACLRDIEPLQGQMLLMNRQLRGLWLAENPDRARINVLQKKAQGLRNALADRLENYHQEVLQLLTPEQQSRIKAEGTGRGMGQMDGRGAMMGGHGYGWGMR